MTNMISEPSSSAYVAYLLHPGSNRITKENMSGETKSALLVE